jgi:zona occludens toxin (predicted ATPase)
MTRSVRLLLGLIATLSVASACASARPAASGAQNAVPSASQTAIANAIAVTNAPFVGSLKSKKVYPAACHTVKLIKPADQVGFSSIADAEKAGFAKDLYSTDCQY